MLYLITILKTVICCFQPLRGVDHVTSYSYNSDMSLIYNALPYCFPSYNKMFNWALNILLLSSHFILLRTQAQSVDNDNTSADSDSDSSTEEIPKVDLESGYFGITNLDPFGPQLSSRSEERNERRGSRIRFLILDRKCEIFYNPLATNCWVEVVDDESMPSILKIVWNKQGKTKMLLHGYSRDTSRDGDDIVTSHGIYDTGEGFIQLVILIITS